MANHRQSKAHRKMVESLKAEFGEEVLDALHDDSDGHSEIEEEDNQAPPLTASGGEGQESPKHQGGTNPASELS